MTLRIGNIVRVRTNPLIPLGITFLEIVNNLSTKDFKDEDKQLLASLVISQTEDAYKQYLIHVLSYLFKKKVGDLIDDWQRNKFPITDDVIQCHFVEDTFFIIHDIPLEGSLEDKDYLFNDGLNNSYYGSRKKSSLCVRSIVKEYRNKELNDLQLIILHFVMTQLLVSWESACVHLGLMLLDDWDISDVSRTFISVWPIYKS